MILLFYMCNTWNWNNNNNNNNNIPAPVLPAARLSLRRFFGDNSFHRTPIGLILVAMGRGLNVTAAETNSAPNDAVSGRSRLPLKAGVEGQRPNRVVLHLKRRFPPSKTGFIQKRRS